MYRKMLIGVTAVIISVGGMKYATTAKSVEASTPCIVTIFGIQYDVSPLGTTHSGPQGTTVDAGAAGFFQCETDMTAVYQSQHGTDVSRLLPFVYTPSTATPTPTVGTTIAPTVDPTVSPSPIPSVSPIPSITPSHHDDENEMEEMREDEHEDELHEINENKHEERIHQSEDSNRGQEVRSIARKERDSDHDND